MWTLERNRLFENYSAHDENDKVLGERHGLEVIDIFNDDASLNKNGLHYEGKDRFEVRKP